MSTNESVLALLWPRICSKFGTPQVDSFRGFLSFGPRHDQKVSLNHLSVLFRHDEFHEIDKLLLHASSDRDTRWEYRFAAMREESGPVWSQR